MTTQINPYLSNPKLVELRQELKNQTPSYEEFAKNYEADEEVTNSYEGEIASFEKKSYGPCSSCSEGSVSRDKTFQLDIVLKNMMGSSRSSTVYSIEQASNAAGDILAAIGHWKGTFGSGGFNRKNRENLSRQIHDKIALHKAGQDVVDYCYSSY